MSFLVPPIIIPFHLSVTYRTDAWGGLLGPFIHLASASWLAMRHDLYVRNVHMCVYVCVCEVCGPTYLQYISFIKYELVGALFYF